MQQIRLIGLVLFIVAILLGMAAVASQTTHIRFRQRAAGEQVFDRGSEATPQNTPEQPGVNPSAIGEESAVEFISVPVVWPILFTALSGLALWFGPAPREPNAKRRSKRRRRR